MLTRFLPANELEARCTLSSDDAVPEVAKTRSALSNIVSPAESPLVSNLQAGRLASLMLVCPESKKTPPPESVALSAVDFMPANA